MATYNPVSATASAALRQYRDGMKKAENFSATLRAVFPCRHELAGNPADRKEYFETIMAAVTDKEWKSISKLMQRACAASGFEWPGGRKVIRRPDSGVIAFPLDLDKAKPKADAEPESGDNATQGAQPTGTKATKADPTEAPTLAAVAASAIAAAAGIDASAADLIKAIGDTLSAADRDAAARDLQAKPGKVEADTQPATQSA